MKPHLLDGGQVVAADSFTGTNGTNLTAHLADTGQSWTRLFGTGAAVLQGNRAQLTSVLNAGTLFTLDAKRANVAVQAVVNFGGSCDAALAFRFQDANNGWYWLLNPVSNQVAILEHAGGSDVARAAAAYTFATGTDYAAKVTANGQVLTGFVNGVPLLSYASADFAAATQCGLLAGGGANGVNIQFDNLRVSTLP